MSQYPVMTLTAALTLALLAASPDVPEPSRRPSLLAATPPPAVADARRAWEATPARDSLKDGALIGAVAGGIALGTYVAVLCRAFGTEYDLSCFKGTLAGAALGAGAGAAAGAGIDALFLKGPRMTFTVRF